MQAYYLKLIHERFLAYPFQVITYHPVIQCYRVWITENAINLINADSINK
jgi:hypothetical protein